MKLDNESVARRYGKALFEVALDKGDRAILVSELNEIKKALHQEPELLVFLTSVQISDQAKRDLLTEITKNTSGLTTNLLNMLYDYGRIVNLEGVIEEFNRLNDEFDKTVRVSVTTAVELDEDQKQRLASSFANVVDANKVIIEPTIDESIIGGVVLEANNTIYDGSVKAKIERIKRLLLK